MNTMNNLDSPAVYEIEIAGQLSDRWAEYFGELRITVWEKENHSYSLISGSFADQAALLGLLHNLYSLGYILISVRRI